MACINKKGQGAMEYLMTYGWAILVVLIVGIILWQLGIFDIGGSSRPKTFTGFGAVKPLSWAIPATGDGVATMLSGESTTITPINCTITFITMGIQCQAIDNSTCNINATGGIKMGTVFKLIFYNCTGGIAGEPYDAVLSVTYNKTIGSLVEPHTSTGNLKGHFE